MNRQKGMRPRAEVEGSVIGRSTESSFSKTGENTENTDVGRRGNVVVTVWNFTSDCFVLFKKIGKVNS